MLAPFMILSILNGRTSLPSLTVHPNANEMARFPEICELGDMDREDICFTLPNEVCNLMSLNRQMVLPVFTLIIPGINFLWTGTLPSLILLSLLLCPVAIYRALTSLPLVLTLSPLKIHLNVFCLLVPGRGNAIVNELPLTLWTLNDTRSVQIPLVTVPIMLFDTAFFEGQLPCGRWTMMT